MKDYTKISVGIKNILLIWKVSKRELNYCGLAFFHNVDIIFFVKI